MSTYWKLGLTFLVMMVMIFGLDMLLYTLFEWGRNSVETNMITTFALTWMINEDWKSCDDS